MKVFLTGATGFVGSHLLAALLEAGHEVQALVRPGHDDKLPAAVRDHASLSILHGDALKPESLAGMDDSCEAVIHLIGIIAEKPLSGVTFEKLHVEATGNVVRAAQGAGVQRLVHMSALGARLQARALYHQTKYDAEFLVKSSPVPWTIFRPSVIFGPGDGFVNLQAGFIRPFVPLVVPGPGRSLLQPVAIENVVEGFLKALTEPKAEMEIYEVGGPDRLTLEQIVDLIAEAKGVASPVKVHVPIALLALAVRFLQLVPGFPLTTDQLIMLGEDNVCDTRGFYEDFSIEPKSFSVQALREYL